MFKKLLLLAALIAIVPLDQEKQAELYEVAKATVSDLSGFCTRNPRVCLKSQSAIQTFTNKAEAGAKLVVDIVNERDNALQDAQTVPVKAVAAADNSAPVKTGALPAPINSAERLPAYTDQYNNHYAAKEPTYDTDTLLPSDKATLLPSETPTLLKP